MKSIYELKNEFAKNQGYQNWDDLFESEQLDDITESWMDNLIEFIKTEL